jgi:hypothetical protein
MLAALAASAIASATPAVATTYQIMLPAATAVSGFITTDGAIGLIGVGDVINYQLTWQVSAGDWLFGDTSAGATVTFTPANSVFIATDFNSIYATPTNLSFGSDGGGVIGVKDPALPPAPYGEIAGNGYSFLSQLVYTHGADPTTVSAFAVGVGINFGQTRVPLVFASAVPGDDDDHHHHHHHHLIDDEHHLGEIWDHDPTAAVPEPSTWAMMLLGFAGLGFAFRQSRRTAAFAFA